MVLFSQKEDNDIDLISCHQGANSKMNESKGYLVLLKKVCLKFRAERNQAWTFLRYSVGWNLVTLDIAISL